MNIVILNGRPLKDFPYYSWFLPHRCHLITGRNYLENISDLELSKYASVLVLDNYENNEALFWHVFDLNKSIKIDRIVSLREIDLIRAAYLREKLKLPGQNLESALSFRDKIKMKSHLKKAGISVPDFRLLNSPVDLYEFIETFGFPVVIKPCLGKRSEGVKIIHDTKALLQHLEKGICAHDDVITGTEVETYVDGILHHVDGLIVNGQLKYISPSQYTTSCVNFHTGSLNGSVMLPSSDPMHAKLSDFVKACLAALPTPSTTSFHAEVFVKSDQSLTLCEIASRTGGGPVRSSLKTAFSIDPDEVVAKFSADIEMQLQSSYQRNQEKGYGCLLIPTPTQHGTLVKAPTKCPFPSVVDFRCLANGYKHSSNELASYLAEFAFDCASFSDVFHEIKIAAQWIKNETNWEFLNEKR